MKTETNTTVTETVTYNYEDLLTEHKTVSAVIRHLNSLGLSRSEISKVTGKRYQHVRNVLVTPLKK
jgi:uncharacterized protein with HEPN domain